MKQYARLFRNVATGVVEHVHVSTAPIVRDVVSMPGEEFLIDDAEIEGSFATWRGFSANDLREALLLQPEIDKAKLPGVEIRKRAKPPP